MTLKPETWKRAKRNDFDLPLKHGLYALFLDDGARLDKLAIPPNRLLYIGLAANRDGIRGRCHFRGKTSSHSPRRSLAAVLLDVLELRPRLVGKSKFGLTTESERKLDDWMHQNLTMAYHVLENPSQLEKQLIASYAPPLNLKNCAPTAQHKFISSKRYRIIAELQAEHSLPQIQKESLIPSGNRKQNLGLNGWITAELLADQLGLNPKSLRSRFRREISWYKKQMSWSFPVGSREANDMIDIAQRMSGQR